MAKYIGNNPSTLALIFDNQHLVTIAQLSRALQIPEKTLRDWVYKRQIPFLKVGKLIRFRVSEIESWISQGV